MRMYVCIHECFFRFDVWNWMSRHHRDDTGSIIHSFIQSFIAYSPFQWVAALLTEMMRVEEVDQGAYFTHSIDLFELYLSKLLIIHTIKFIIFCHSFDYVFPSSNFSKIQKFTIFSQRLRNCLLKAWNLNIYCKTIVSLIYEFCYQARP